MAKPEISDYKQVLFVEGDSDLQFYKAVLKQNFGLEVFIQNCQGRDQTKDVLEARINASLLAEKTHLGVLIDADNNARDVAESFAALLRKLTGQDVIVGGWTEGQPHVGLWIAPDCENSGEIETLVWRAWSSDDANAGQKACVESYVACMEKSGHGPKSVHKGLVNSLLALKNDDDPRLGPGARAKIFDFSRPEFVSLLAFLKGFES
jgi:hypothetical protein